MRRAARDPARSSSSRSRPSWSSPAWGSSRSQSRASRATSTASEARSLLARGAPPYGNRRQAARETELLEDRADPGASAPGRPHGESQVLLHGQLLVQERLVAEHGHLASHGTPISHEIPAEHVRLARVDGQQPREDLEEARLARPIRAAQVYDLSFANFQTSSCEEGKPAGKRHGLMETNGRRHGDRPCYGPAGAQVTREGQSASPRPP